MCVCVCVWVCVGVCVWGGGVCVCVLYTVFFYVSLKCDVINPEEIIFHH